MPKLISEQEFRERVVVECERIMTNDMKFGAVTGPGRSGAIASVYMSHYLGVPFIPFKTPWNQNTRMLIADTAIDSGKTLRKAMEFYSASRPLATFFYREPPRLKFWYEHDV